MTASVFDTFPTLETSRLRLRRIVKSDAAAWLAVWNPPEVWLRIGLAALHRRHGPDDAMGH